MQMVTHLLSKSGTIIAIAEALIQTELKLKSTN